MDIRLLSLHACVAGMMPLTGTRPDSLALVAERLKSRVWTEEYPIGGR